MNLIIQQYSKKSVVFLLIVVFLFSLVFVTTTQKTETVPHNSALPDIGIDTSPDNEYTLTTLNGGGDGGDGGDPPANEYYYTIPSDGDLWTESTTSWGSYNICITTDSSIKQVGTYSIKGSSSGTLINQTAQSNWKTVERLPCDDGAYFQAPFDYITTFSVYVNPKTATTLDWRLGTTMGGWEIDSGYDTLNATSWQTFSVNVAVIYGNWYYLTVKPEEAGTTLKLGYDGNPQANLKFLNDGVIDSNARTMLKLSGKFANFANDNREFYYNSAKSLSLDCENRYEFLNFRIRQDNQTDDPQLRLYNNATSYFYRTVDVTTNDTWQSESIDVGSGSSGWSSQGTPDWTDIDYIAWHYTAAQSNVTETFLDSLYFDSTRTFGVSAPHGCYSCNITPSYTTGISASDITGADGDTFDVLWQGGHWYIANTSLGVDNELDFEIGTDFEGKNTTLVFDEWYDDPPPVITHSIITQRDPNYPTDLNDYVYINTTVTDDNLDTVLICHNISASFVNYTMTNTFGDDTYNYTMTITGLVNGQTVAYRFYANDTINNQSMKDNNGLDFMFMLGAGDTDPPDIILDTPTNNTLLLAGDTWLNFTLADVSSISWFKLSWNGGANITVTSPYDHLYDTTTLLGGVNILRAFARDSAGNEGLQLFVFQIDLGVLVALQELSDNQHLDYSIHIITVNITALSPSLSDITVARFRYKYENPALDDQEIWSAWLSLTLITGDSDSGIYEGSLTIDSALFDEDDAYSLQVKGVNDNGMSTTRTINFIVDKTASSGLQLGSLLKPKSIQCGNFTDDICFSVTATVHTSQRSYTKIIPNDWKKKLGNDIDLITFITTSAGNKSEITLYKTGGEWKFKIAFPKGYEPADDFEFKIYFYEDEPKISNPILIYTGKDTVDFSLDISTNRNWTIPIWIGETWMPTTQNAWWSEYLPNELTYSVYSDKDLTHKLTDNVTVVTIDPYDPYKIALDIKGFDPQINLTKIYIHGSVEVTRPVSAINFSAILFGMVFPVAGFTVFLLDREMRLKLPRNIAKYLMLGSLIGGIAFAVIFQFISFPTLAIHMPSLSFAPVVDFIAASTVLHMILITLAPFLIAVAFSLRLPIESRFKVQIISAAGIISLLIGLGFITGMIQLSLLDVGMRATINLASYIGVGIALVLIIYIAKTVRPIGE